MIKTVTILFLIFLSGCSLKTPVNNWQYKSANAYNSYTKNFLSDNEVLAKNDLSRATKHAKKSADLTQLAKVYLGECALNISVGIEDNCEKYRNISSVVNDKELDVYYQFIDSSIKENQVKYLPKRYHSFAYNILKKDFKNANKDILNMKKPLSSFLCAGIIKEKIQRNTIQKIIDLASYRGYKRVVLFWLNESLKHTQNQQELSKIRKKILIMKSE